MKKIVLIDGNNLLFRSFYATSYKGNMMKNSKDFPTNALYGFVTMINKIIKEEKPTFLVVAFDIGKNFRKQEFDFYKEGRQQTPEELKIQMPYARKILDAMGIKYLEMEPYEADDIIGTVVKMTTENKDFDATIISSDKDLLQLINYETDIKLLKQTGYIRYTEKSFKEEYKINPINIIDLKALMGDSSDNIPGVKGIGEKTALKLLQEYQTIENLYDNIDKIKGSVHDKLVNDKNSAFMSKKIATIYKDVPLNIDLENLVYEGPKANELINIYKELEFNSLLKTIDSSPIEENIKYIMVNDNINVVLDKKVSLYVETNNETYINSDFIGAVVTDSKYYYYFNKDNIKRLKEILKDKEIITYDHKKNMYILDIDFDAKHDVMISSYLLGLNVTDDIAVLASYFNYKIEYFNTLIKNDNNEEIINNMLFKAKFIFEKNDELINKLEDNNLYDLYTNIEMPLIKVLASMEKVGVKVDKNELINQGNSITLKLENITQKIYNYAGVTFNISSPKQLGEILFDKMEIGKGKKNKTGYKTDVTTLEKLLDVHPIIECILEYRALAKLKSTYIDGLQNTILSDGKIHTTFKQTITRTGRLSSVEPNLQNIPVKEEMGRNIRKAFIPSNDLFLSCDYSQIELRVLAHMASCQSMIDTFLNDGDIHAKVASDINDVQLEAVTKEMRSKAKSVIFGIVYGISGFGLKENLHIKKEEADFFINKYYDLYPEVLKYMTDQIKFAKDNGYVKTLFNRKRYIEELNSTNFMVKQTGERMAINSPIQGTAADIIKMAMIKVYDEFQKNNLKSKMVLQVHDELIFDVDKNETIEVKNIVKNVMENITIINVPLKVSLDTGSNWYETK